VPRNGPPIVAERAHDIYGNYPFIVTNMTQEKGWMGGLVSGLLDL
jgi:hypothetical protein